ncbi:MAG: TlpA disulfide reductase family protein [Dehalococcoidia bacterium]
MPTRRLARYATVAAIVLVVGGIFVYRDVLPAMTGAQYGPVSSSAHPAMGQPAPDFVLQEAGSGRVVRLSDYRGKSVVLNFWATWCGPCRSEMPEFQKTYAARDGDVVILAVDYRESDELVSAFRQDFGLTFPLLMDRQGTVREQYGAQGLPATFFIDRDGILRAQNLGPVVGQLLPDGLRAADQGSR